MTPWLSLCHHIITSMNTDNHYANLQLLTVASIPQIWNRNLPVLGSGPPPISNSFPHLFWASSPSKEEVNSVDWKIGESKNRGEVLLV